MPTYTYATSGTYNNATHFTLNIPQPRFQYALGKIFKCNLGGVWKVEGVDSGRARMRCIAAYRPGGAMYPPRPGTPHPESMLTWGLSFDGRGIVNNQLHLIEEIEP